MKNSRGQAFTYNNIQHLLNNRRYIGEYSYRDVVIPDGTPVVVPKDLFDRVQEKLAKNKKASARHKAEDDYLLTTKLFCGYCGAYLCGHQQRIGHLRFREVLRTGDSSTLNKNHRKAIRLKQLPDGLLVFQNAAEN